VADEAIGPPVADVAVVVGKTPCRESVQGTPGPAVIERRCRPVTLDARAGLVTHPAGLGIERRSGSVTAQAPERGVALGGWVRWQLVQTGEAWQRAHERPAAPASSSSQGRFACERNQTWLWSRGFKVRADPPAGPGNRWWSDNRHSWAG